MKNYKYILFDLDGTLIYSHPGIFSCIRYALEQLGEPAPTDEQLPLCIGPSLMYSFTEIFGLDEARAEEATRKYREQYEKTGMWQNEPVEGVLSALKTLKEHGYILAMATSKPSHFADRIAEKRGFSKYFSAQVGSGMDDGYLPTKAAVIGEAMRRLGATADECLMIGDRKHDVEGARENGVDCALLRVGYASEEEISACAPEYVFDGFADLVAALTKA